MNTGGHWLQHREGLPGCNAVCLLGRLLLNVLLLPEEGDTSDYCVGDGTIAALYNRCAMSSSAAAALLTIKVGMSPSWYWKTSPYCFAHWRTRSGALTLVCGILPTTGRPQGTASTSRISLLRYYVLFRIRSYLLARPTYVSSLPLITLL